LTIQVKVYVCVPYVMGTCLFKDWLVGVSLKHSQWVWVGHHLL